MHYTRYNMVIDNLFVLECPKEPRLSLVLHLWSLSFALNHFAKAYLDSTFLRKKLWSWSTFYFENVKLNLFDVNRRHVCHFLLSWKIKIHWVWLLNLELIKLNKNTEVRKYWRVGQKWVCWTSKSERVMLHNSVTKFINRLSITLVTR